MHLHEVIIGLRQLSVESIVFAERINGKFRPQSVAVVVELSEAELRRPISEVAAERAPGMEYFLEASIALEILEVSPTRQQRQEQDLDAVVERIIHYAEHDA